MWVFELQYLYERVESVKVTATYTGFPLTLKTFHFPAILVTGVVTEEDPYLINVTLIFPNLSRRRS